MSEERTTPAVVFPRTETIEIQEVPVPPVGLSPPGRIRQGAREYSNQVRHFGLRIAPANARRPGAWSPSSLMR